jgi:hypothetical protein
VLHLPDVAELVADEVVRGAVGRPAQQDRVPGRVAVEAAKPGKSEQPRRRPYAHMVDSHGTQVEVETVEPGAGPLECRLGLRAPAQLVVAGVMTKA